MSDTYEAMGKAAITSSETCPVCPGLQAALTAAQAEVAAARAAHETCRALLDEATRVMQSDSNALHRTQAEVETLQYDLRVSRSSGEQLGRLVAEKDKDRLWERARAEKAEAEVERLTRERDQVRATKDGAYAERNQVVALLARMALALGWRAGVGQHIDKPGEAWEPDWRTLLAIDLPTGQVTWHFHDSQKHLLAGLPVYAAEWDGHDTPEKYRRVNACAPAAARVKVLEEALPELSAAAGAVFKAAGRIGTVKKWADGHAKQLDDLGLALRRLAALLPAPTPRLECAHGRPACRDCARAPASAPTGSTSKHTNPKCAFPDGECLCVPQDDAPTGSEGAAAFDAAARICEGRQSGHVPGSAAWLEAGKCSRVIRDEYAQKKALAAPSRGEGTPEAGRVVVRAGAPLADEEVLPPYSEAEPSKLVCDGCGVPESKHATVNGNPANFHDGKGWSVCGEFVEAPLQPPAGQPKEKP